MKKTEIRDILRNLTLASQFGISFVSPLIMCVAVCWWLTARLGVGGWVYIPGFFFGLGASFSVGYKLYLSVTGRLKKEKKKVSFNRHH